MTARLAYVPLASTLHDGEALNRLIAAFVPALEQAGAERFEPAAVGTPLPLIVVVERGRIPIASPGHVQIDPAVESL